VPSSSAGRTLSDIQRRSIENRSLVADQSGLFRGVPPVDHSEIFPKEDHHMATAEQEPKAATSGPKKYKVIGTRPVRHDGVDKVTGRARYGADIRLTGMLAGEPVRLVKCETNDLEVPADAEIIIEGEICPDYKVEEGPFGEYTGYRTSPRDFRVTRELAILIRARVMPWHSSS